MQTISYGHAQTPLGTVLLTSRDGDLTGLYFEGHAHTPEIGAAWVRDEGAFGLVRGQLDEYFAGRRTTFEVPLRLDGSPFQLAVWSALREIPYGETTSYGEIARRIGRSGSARAVGAAHGRNPISIIIPCHRVIGADATLTGYGWGVDRKAWLIDHEQSRGSQPSLAADFPTTSSGSRPTFAASRGQTRGHASASGPPPLPHPLTDGGVAGGMGAESSSWRMYRPGVGCPAEP
jgi:methylated-DNA-[protein]-cysteine S-methyltransferase